MYNNFVFVNKLHHGKFVINYFKYFEDEVKIDEKTFAEFVFQNIKNGLTKYKIEKELTADILKRIIKTRMENYDSIKSGYIGVDSEIFYIGFLNQLLGHKIISKNNSLEAAGCGIDILSMEDNFINISEVKSSTQLKNHINEDRILAAINSFLCKESKVLDQQYEYLMSIVETKEFTSIELSKFRNFVEKYIKSDFQNFEDYALQELIEKNIQVNLLIVSKEKLDLNGLFFDNLENQYKIINCQNDKKTCSMYKNGECQRITQLLHINKMDINIYQVQLSNDFSNLTYYQNLNKEVENYERD